MKLPQFYVDDLIRTAIKEDINYLDVSTDYVIDPDAAGTAKFVSKADGVLCGIDVAMRVFELIDPSFTAEVLKHDGEALKQGDEIAVLHGKTAMLLKGERTALNLVQHMSGIATATHLACEAVRGTRAQVTDTRKTLPGMRALQKYAVVCGGGKNHRFNLSDGAMLKDNHIDACGSITAAVEKVRSKLGHMVKVEVETRTLEEVQEALAVKAEIIMLDNMSCEQMAQAVRLADGRALLEASGNVTLDNIRAVAETGVDIISLGALTHSVHAFDISMRIQR